MTEFTLGARASCTDGFCGVIGRAIVDPAALTVTHLVIEPGQHHHAGGRLVPVELAEGAAGEIKLRCTLDEFGRLGPAEQVDVASGGYRQASPVRGHDAGVSDQTPVLLSHVVPLGEAEVQRHDCVHATDGEIGQVEGLAVGTADHKVTHVLLREGHLWGRKQVAIPASAVTSVDAGIQLNVTKKQVQELPPLDPAG